MVVFNPSKREIGAKIVYYGPAAGGKTTNLRFVYGRLNPKQRGELISLATKDDRTLFFDFLPLDLGTVKGFNVRFHLYTVPGQVYYVSTRRAVLTGVDGVVFVADSQEEKLAENIESLEDLGKNLLYYGKRIDEIPMVLQYNKRDLPKISSIQVLNTKVNRQNLTTVEAVALNGKGVMETLTLISKKVLEGLEDSSKKPKTKVSSPSLLGRMASPSTKGDREALIELESEEKVFDIERLRAERRATIDRLLKQKEQKELSFESLGYEPGKKEKPLGLEKQIEFGETEAIDQEFTEEDFEKEVELFEENFEFEVGENEGSPMLEEPSSTERSMEIFPGGEKPLEFEETKQRPSEAEGGGLILGEEESQTEIEEAPLDLEDSQEWVELETEEKTPPKIGSHDLGSEAEFLQKEPLPAQQKIRGIDIVSWGKPEKILPNTITFPLTIKFNDINKEAKIIITIDLEDLIG